MSALLRSLRPYWPLVVSVVWFAVVAYLVATGHLFYQSQNGAHEVVISYGDHAEWFGFSTNGGFPFYVGGF